MKSSLCVVVLALFLEVIKSKKLIAVSPFDPMVRCPLNTVGKDSTFTGLDLEMFKKVAEAMKWTDNDWDFACVEWNQMLNDILTTNKYYAGTGGISILYDRIQSGYVFSIPTLSTGVSIVDNESLNPWLFLDLFEPRLGILLLVTPLVCSFLFFIFEQRKEPYEEYLWHSYASLFFVNTVPLHRTSSRIVQVALWFLMLILISTYTANMTAVTSVNEILNGINSPDDLNQKKVITYEGYNILLYPYGAKPLTQPGIDDIVISKISSYLSEDVAAAYVLDDPQAQIAVWMDCHLTTKGRQFETVNYGVMFSNKTDKAEINKMNAAIEEVSSKLSADVRIKTYIESHPDWYPRCERSVNPDKDKIGVENVKGLWIILGIAIGVSIVLFLITKLPGYHQKVRFLITKGIFKDWSDDAEEKKFGDDLIEDNLKNVVKRVFDDLQETVDSRLNIMEQRIDRFYELLLRDEMLNGGGDNNSNDNIQSEKEKAKTEVKPMEIGKAAGLLTKKKQ
eukprot:TRINITY_DN2803_c0_g1_i3.p1 TRINITY_DN2803_c0_g1~~TRINITY_DN2803_c0_g1_i3.p1  ORF type:complete len:507 (+),score=103.79 TRINITY_DN2803_c0_g1_i3:40-1560(+)